METRLHSKETCRIEQLMDDLLVHVLSFLTVTDVVRTSVISRRWRNLWRYNSCLDFDATTLLPRHRLTTSCAWYIEWVNKVIESRAVLHGLPSVKVLQIRYKLDARQGCHIDRWVNFAVANRIETLHLECSPYFGMVPPSNQYILSEEPWLKAPAGLSSLKCLRSLFLKDVNVDKQFIEFILSNCPVLEDLSLRYDGTNNFLNVSGAPPLRLRRLKVEAYGDFAINKLCAPHLTSFYYKSRKFKPQKVNVPMLKDLAIGGFYRSQPIANYLEHFWNYFPQLEKLYLILEEDKAFKLNANPGLVKLKYLEISVNWDTNPFVYPIINFIKACPLLETFAFQVLDGDVIDEPLLCDRTQEWCRMGMGGCFKYLKVLKLYGGHGKTIDQQIVKFIIDMSPHLEKLIVEISFTSAYSHLHSSEPETIEAVETKAKKLCEGQGSPREVKITVN